MCRLIDDDNPILIAQDKGEPPSWFPAFGYPDANIHWIDREIFNKIKAERMNKPCKICPKEIECKNRKRR
jgi:hypothetical protein